MIVPNTRFNIFIDEVSTNLEISDMPRYTMAQYYLELIEKYQRQIYTDMVESNRPIIQKIQKIKKCDFLKTNGLDPNNVFGLDLEKDICNFYDQKFSEYLSDIHADRILELAQQFEIDTLFAHDVSKEKSNAKKLNYLNLYLQKILEILNRLTKKEQVALQEAKEKSTNYKTFKRHLKNLLHDMKALMYEYKVDQESSFYSLLERICPKRINIEKLELLKKEADVLNTKIQSETSGFLRFETDEEDQSKLDILQNQINEIEQQISGEKEELPETLLRIFDNLEKFKKWREGNVYIVAKLGDILEKYDRLIDLIFHEDIAFSVLMLEFKELHRSFNNSEETQNVKRQIEIAQDNYNKAREQVLSLEDQEIVDHAHEQLEIRAELVIRFFEMFEDTGFAEINNARQLFIILAMYLLHVGKIIIDFDYVFIDEAQDYSDIEYRLLRGIHGKNTIIELYGDYMQKITPNRGIDNWNALKPMFSNEYYELKENYRNTVEIANYVNVHIKDIFTTIGLHGEIVYKLGNNWKQVVNHEINETPERRVAVICKNETIKGEINSGLSSNAIIYTVIEAKGLEFDSVYLIDKDMTDNEKYIACSRALKILNIVGSY